jgi:hypothetical protein
MRLLCVRLALVHSLQRDVARRIRAHVRKRRAERECSVRGFTHKLRERRK